MPRARSTFKQTDVTRLLKAAAAAGMPVSRFDVDKDGRISVYTGHAIADPVLQPDPDSTWADVDAS